MEINFNTNGSKLVKQEELIRMAQVADENTNLYNHKHSVFFEYLRTLQDMIEDNANTTMRTIRELSKAVNDTLPTKYRPSFSTKAEEIINRAEQAISSDMSYRIEDLHQTIEFLQKKYGFDK
jgi:hypothetical protein